MCSSQPFAPESSFRFNVHAPAFTPGQLWLGVPAQPLRRTQDDVLPLRRSAAPASENQTWPHVCEHFAPLVHVQDKARHVQAGEASGVDGEKRVLDCRMKCISGISCDLNALQSNIIKHLQMDLCGSPNLTDVSAIGHGLQDMKNLQHLDLNFTGSHSVAPERLQSSFDSREGWANAAGIRVYFALSGDECIIHKLSVGSTVRELCGELQKFRPLNAKLFYKIIYKNCVLHNQDGLTLDMVLGGVHSVMSCEADEAAEEAAALLSTAWQACQDVHEPGEAARERDRDLPTISALSLHMLNLSLEQLSNEPPPGYIFGYGCFGHVESGVMVRSEPIHLTPVSDRDVVLYHYTDLAGFSAVTGKKDIKQLRASYAKRAHFGDGIYASQHPPDYFRSKENILLNNYTNSFDIATQQEQIKMWQDKGVADYCLPLVVSRDLAVNVATEMTKEMEKPGHTLMHGPMREDRDIWVVVISDGSEVTHGNEDLDSVHYRWVHGDFCMRLDAVEIFAKYAAMGNLQATNTVLQSLYDDDFNVRIAAIWATAGSKALTASERVVAITKLAQNEPVEVVTDAAKEALILIDHILDSH